MEQATGLEKKELDAQIAGEEVSKLKKKIACINFRIFFLSIYRIHLAWLFTKLSGVQRTSQP